MPQQTVPFSELFQDRLRELELRALRAHTNMTNVCRDIEISRSTPDRWRRRLPRTIEIIDQLEKSVVEAEKKAAIENGFAEA